MEVHPAILPGRLKRGTPPQPDRSQTARLKFTFALS
jgi:hypothetical protein